MTTPAAFAFAICFAVATWISFFVWMAVFPIGQQPAAVVQHTAEVCA